MALRLSRRLVALTAGALVAAVAAPLTATAAPAPLPERPARVPASDRFAAPPIDWGPCDPGSFPTNAADGSSLVPASYLCAQYPVPLDYDRPDREQITLALVKRPADAPGEPQGTMFLNPGGPGGSGVESVAFGGEDIFGPEVEAAFDIVGFDPRGISGPTGGSTTLQCYPTVEALEEDFASDLATAAWPETDEEFAASVADARDLAADCARNAGPIIKHMGTTNVARDLDVLRRAEGDPQLNFIGYSYGTGICAYYIAQYAERAGAVVCDANFNPVEYATGERLADGFRIPATARIGSEEGTNPSLEEFFRLCDEGGPERCAFAPNAKARFQALYDTLSVTPLDLDGFAFDERSLVARSNGPLYNSLFGYPFLAAFYAELELLVAGGTPPVLPEVEPEVLPPVEQVYPGPEGFLGVFCSDKLQPRRFSAWRQAIANGEGLFGPFWAAGDLPCATWPAYDYDTVYGPFGRATPNPVLIVNSRFDPATPWGDAVDHERLYPKAALLTVEGWGHVGQGLSQCGDDIIDTYVLTRTVPADQMTCTQDIVPFSPESLPPAPEPAAPAEAEAIPEEVLAAAVDAAVSEIADGNDAGADAAAADAVVAGLEQAGRTELAAAIRGQEAILRQARTGLYALR